MLEGYKYLGGSKLLGGSKFCEAPIFSFFLRIQSLTRQKGATNMLDSPVILSHFKG